MMDVDGGMVFGGLFMWVLWLILIVIVIVVVKAFMGGGGRTTPESPMDILRKRYARGEIDEEEFKRRRRDLET